MHTLEAVEYVEDTVFDFLFQTCGISSPEQWKHLNRLWHDIGKFSRLLRRIAEN